MKTLVLLLFLNFLALDVNAECIINTAFHPDQPAKAKIGTYQIQISDTKNIPVFSDEILIEVEQKRLQSETAFIYPMKGVVIIIPSKDSISDSSFIPLEEVVFL